LATTVGNNYVELQNSASADTLAWQAADTTLQGNIDAEAATRAAADAAIQADVDANEAAMAAADAALQAQIDASAADITNLTADMQAMYFRHQRDDFAVVSSGDYVATMSFAMEPGSLQVFVNGLLKRETDDYTLTLSGSAAESVTVLGAEAGDDVVVMGQFHFELAS